jgi:hypothetical protein
MYQISDPHQALKAFAVQARVNSDDRRRFAARDAKKRKRSRQT